MRYQPGGVLEYLFYPFVIAFHPLRGSEFPFRDFRLAAVCSVVLAFLAVLGWRWMKRRQTAQPVWRLAPAATVFLGVVAISYVGWLNLESLYRYALTLELLSFVILAVLLCDMLTRKRALAVLALVAALLIPATPAVRHRPSSLGPRPLRGATQLPSGLQVAENAIVLLAGANGGTYYIPAFPPSVRFLGADVVDQWPAHAGELRGPPAPEAMLEPFAQRMHEITGRHAGQVLLVYLANDSRRVDPVLRAYGYALGQCGVIRSNIAAVPPLRLCELGRN